MDSFKVQSIETRVTDAVLLRIRFMGDKKLVIEISPDGRKSIRSQFKNRPDDLGIVA